MDEENQPTITLVVDNSEYRLLREVRLMRERAEHGVYGIRNMVPAELMYRVIVDGLTVDEAERGNPVFEANRRWAGQGYRTSGWLA